MNMRKTIKKIAAVAAGTTLLASSILGAAADLSAYPSPFVKDGVADVQFVIGSGSTDDYLGVLDIATSLQADAVKSESVNVGGTTEVSVEGGYDLSGTSQFYLGSDLSLKGNLDDTELPVLLADGEVAYDGKDYDTSQDLVFSASPIIYAEEDNEPVLKLDLENASEMWKYTLTFDDTFKAVDSKDKFEESFTIEMLGKVFTIPEDQSDVNTASELKMFGSDVTTLLTLSTPVTVESDGETYTIEVTGANKDAATAIINVNGHEKTVEDGKSYTIGGLDIFVDDLFITDIPSLDARASVFVGSNEIILRNNKEVKIDDEPVSGLTSKLTYSSGKVLQNIEISYAPDNLNKDVPGYDEVEFVEAGDSVTDPLFGTFSVDFVGPNYDLESEDKALVEVNTPSDDVELVVETEEGKVTFTPYNLVAGKLQFAANDSTDDDDGFVGLVKKGADLEKKNIFILNEDDSERVTKVYEVKSVDEDDGVELLELASDKTITVKKTKEIEDTGVKIASINDTAHTFTLDDDTELVLFLKGGKQSVTLADMTTPKTTATITLDENEVDKDVYATGKGKSVVFSLAQDGSDDEVDVTVPTYTGFSKASSKSEDLDTFLSKAGTYVVADNDEQEYAKAYVPIDEDYMVEYNVFVAPTGAKVVTTGGSSSVQTQTVNPIAVGVAVRDVDVNLANPAHNLIVVGGSCINTVSATLMGVPANSCGTDSGLNAGEAVIELFDLDNGKKAMLIAGWEAVQTQAAARAVATNDAALTGNKVVVKATSASQYTIE